MACDITGATTGEGPAAEKGKTRSAKGVDDEGATRDNSRGALASARRVVKLFALALILHEGVIAP